MIVSIHQPNHLPYLGFFDKIVNSDIFVIHDDAQFNDTDFHHRNRIRVTDGWKWLTVPVHRKEIPINEILIKNNSMVGKRLWNEAHFEILSGWYKKAPYFDSYASDLKKIYSTKFEKLSDLNIALIHFLCDAFDLSVEIRYSSEFNLHSKRTQRIVDTVHSVGGDTYLSGISGKDYMNMSLFNDMDVVFQKYKHPTYKQCYDGFVPNMSAIDALFNIGKLPVE